ncbi:DUF2232 domain-containing protein [Bradyrhizobium acaciae]|uniref:DUF2232 domain-containing protein n=1 Tax=Bradyrhizobium acaciae TaxID=2683706 RepID=UPI001E395A56|nr:DUF2232 domain-containing protein [Bradyrhizobium acaciae]MCC8984151.1 DUF2232 domain-containing protein [Bradyrhizobium acaciae]
MIAILIVALAAGAASALMFASVSSGAAIALLLAYSAPLPLLVVALGWGPLASVVSGIVATAALTTLSGLLRGIKFALGVALPAWWLGHLVLLGRLHNTATSTDRAGNLEWYPIDRILIWILVIAVLTTVSILLPFGIDADAIAETVRQALQVVARQAETDWTPEQITFLAKLFAYLAPLFLPMSVTLMFTLNLWLAAKVALTSGRLHRPWTDLRNIVLPPIALAVLAAAVALCFAGGTIAMLAETVAGALLFAYAIVGFAALHILTLSARNRTFWLACVYVLAVMFYVPVLVMAALGVADAVLGLRQRFLQTRPPPLPAE